MSFLRTTVYGLLLALGLPLAAGELSLQVTNPTSSPWRIWASAPLRLAEEGAPADPAGLQVPAQGTLQVRLTWEDGPAHPLFHAERVGVADTLVWTMAPDRIPVGAFLWTLRLQAPSPELLLRSVADPILLPSPPPPPGSSSTAIPPQQPDLASTFSGDDPSPSPQGSPSESSSSRGTGPRSKLSRKGRPQQVYATLEFETRGNWRRITLLDVVRPPMVTRSPIPGQGVLDADTELGRWATLGRQRYLDLAPGYRYTIKVSENSYFARDPLIVYSRVLVLSGPGGNPWNAATLVGSREGIAEQGDPWRFRLRTGDTLPGFQEEVGGRRNHFLFGAVEAGLVHGATAWPVPARNGAAGQPSNSRKRARPQEGGDEAPTPNKRPEGVLTEITVRNHLGSDCFLRADDVRRMRKGGRLMDLEGSFLAENVPWTRLAGYPETSRFLRIPAGQAVHLPLNPFCQWGPEKRQRLLHLEVPGGAAGANLLAVQGPYPPNGSMAPWQWFLRDVSGREAAQLPGLELVDGRILEIRPQEGKEDARPLRGESKQPLEDEWEVVEESGFAPVAGNGSPQGSGLIPLPSPPAPREDSTPAIPPGKPGEAPGSRGDDASSSTQGSPSEPSGGRSPAPALVRKVRGRPYAVLEFETRGGSRRITLLDVDRSPKVTRRSLPVPGSPEPPEASCRWTAEGRRRYLDLAPGYLYSITVSENSYFARDPLLPYSRALVLSGPGGEPWNAAALVGSSNRVAGARDAWRFRLRAEDTLPGFQEEAGGQWNRFVFGAVEAGAVHGVTSLPLQAEEATPDQRSHPGKRALPQEAPDEVPGPNKRRTKVVAEITVRNHLGVPCFLHAEGVTRSPLAGILMDLENHRLPGLAPWRKQPGHPDSTRALMIPSGRAVLLQMDASSRLGFKAGERLIHIVIPGGPTGATLLASRKPGAATGKPGPWAWSLRAPSGQEATQLPGLTLVDGTTLEVRPPDAQDETKAPPPESKDDEASWWVVEADPEPAPGNDPAQEPGPSLMDLALAALAGQADEEDPQAGENAQGGIGASQ